MRRQPEAISLTPTSFCFSTMDRVVGPGLRDRPCRIPEKVRDRPNRNAVKMAPRQRSDPTPGPKDKAPMRRALGPNCLRRPPAVYASLRLSTIDPQLPFWVERLKANDFAGPSAVTPRMRQANDVNCSCSAPQLSSLNFQLRFQGYCRSPQVPSSRGELPLGLM